MKKTITQSEFVSEFDKFSEGYRDKFSYEGKIALFNWLQEYEEDTGEELELDVIALCCDYTEYRDALEGAKEYGYKDVVDLNEHGSVDLLEVKNLENKQAKEWLEERTVVLEFEGGIIIQNF